MRPFVLFNILICNNDVFVTLFKENSHTAVTVHKWLKSNWQAAGYVKQEFREAKSSAAYEVSLG